MQVNKWKQMPTEKTDTSIFVWPIKSKWSFDKHCSWDSVLSKHNAKWATYSSSASLVCHPPSTRLHSLWRRRRCHPQDIIAATARMRWCLFLPHCADLIVVLVIICCICPPRMSSGLRIQGEFHTKDFFMFLAKFGFQKTDLRDSANTQGYIFGNVTLIQPDVAGPEES